MATPAAMLGVEWPKETAFSCSLFSMVASCTSTSSPPAPTSFTSSLLSLVSPSTASRRPAT
jgi:hypothetical protein